MSIVQKNMTFTKGLKVVAFQLSILLLTGCNDTINVTNGSGQAVGLMADGQDSSGIVNDRSYISAATAINIGALSLSTQSNEVVGFTNDRPPKYLA
jgi:uncharacterized protein YcfL